LALAADAKDLTDPKCGCQITVPDAWSMIPLKAPQGAYVAAAHNAEQTQGTSLYVTTAGETDEGQANYIKGFEYSLTNNGITILSREHQQIGIYNFYVVEGTQAGKNGTIHCSGWITFANKQVFQIALYSQTTDPVKDPALLALIHSFKLTGP
jgi:hypothetical protein